MHPRIQEVLDFIAGERVALRAAVDAVPRARREERPAADRWSVAEVLEHLSVVETRIGHLLSAQLAEARANGLGAESESTPVMPTVPLRFLLDRGTRVTAPDVLHPRGALDADTAWSALERSRDALRAAVMSADGLAIGTLTRPHPVLGVLTLYQWIASVGGHEARHAAQIREIGALLNEAHDLHGDGTDGRSVWSEA